MQHGKIHCAPDRAVCCHPASHQEKPYGKPQHYLQNRALFSMSERDRIPPIIYFSSTPESLQETESPLTGTPWMNAHREGAHVPHHKEPDLFCPHGTHKDSFIPCSPSIPMQNGMY